MSQIPVGIDLGTTYSALAAINAAGRPEIVPNADGERLTPSAVYFPQGGAPVVGRGALDVAGAYPDRVARWVKRHIGDPDWAFEVGGERYSAPQVSGMVLAKLKADAEERIGEVKHAVITVPAYFDEFRRKATMDAAAQAGLEVLRIINEPTAAAIVYAAARKATGKVLIYDFGGGTFDVSIVEISSAQEIRVVTSEGDHQLGGHDLDRRLAGHFAEEFQRLKSLDVREQPEAWHRMLQAAEDVKRALSKVEQRRQVPLQWGAHQVNVDVERGQFEAMVQDELMRTEMLVDNALSGAGLQASDIADVILVGGSTRVPAVAQMLAKKFGREPATPMNVDESVALGAAIQAGVLMQEQGLTTLSSRAARKMSQTRIQDVANHAYGTLSIERVHGVEKLRNTIIIPKDTPIPATVTDTFSTMSDGQERMKCTVTQASNNEETDPEFVQLVLEDFLEFPPGRPAGCPIEITYAYNANQRMSCLFKDVQSGRVKEMTLEVSGAGASAAGDARPPEKGGGDALDDLEADFADLDLDLD